MRDYFRRAKSLARHSKWIISAYIRAFLSRCAMPPGALINLRKQEFGNRLYLYNRGRSSNNIFKASQSDRLIICLTDLKRGRRLLAAQGDNLIAESILTTDLFPKGILRVLEGSDHQHYRQVLVKALDLLPNQLDEKFSRIINHWLQKHASRFPDKASTPAELTTTLSKISTALLIHMYFGVRFGTREFDELMTVFHNLGPNGLVWSIDAKQKESFEKIQDCILNLQGGSAGSDKKSREASVIQGIVDAESLDDVALGNLIYMIEMGRYDVYSLFHWLLKYATENPEIMQKIAEEDCSAAQRSVGLAQAFVQETLRMAQSERLIRIVQNDFVFDGYFFPRHAYVRFCLWESHKSEKHFPDAFAFRPQRFIDSSHGIDSYAPFGLDKHRCPMANPVVLMGTLLIENLAEKFRLEMATQSSENRGPYHWQPGVDFSVGLYERKSTD